MTPATEEAKKELRAHQWLCDQSWDNLDDVKRQLWKIEVERAERYGRTDPIAVKADSVMWGVRKQMEGLTEIRDKLEEEDPPEIENTLQAESRGGAPMTLEEIDQVANKVAAKVLDEITPTVLDPGGKGMLLHFTEHEMVGAGLVVNEARARASPCNCFTYRDREYCFSPGVIGMMSSEVNPEQVTEYCAVGKTHEVKPGIKQRFESFAEAAEEAHKKIEAIPKGERLVPWFSAMGEELEKRSIEV